MTTLKETPPADAPQIMVDRYHYRESPKNLYRMVQLMSDYFWDIVAACLWFASIVFLCFI